MRSKKSDDVYWNKGNTLLQLGKQSEMNKLTNCNVNSNMEKKWISTIMVNNKWWKIFMKPTYIIESKWMDEKYEY